MKKAVITALALANIAMASALAQMSSEVKFEPSNYGTLLSGTISGDENYDYRLGPNGGPELFVQLTVDGTNVD